jgi:hypothetical protein
MQLARQGVYGADGHGYGPAGSRREFDVPEHSLPLNLSVATQPPVCLEVLEVHQLPAVGTLDGELVVLVAGDQQFEFEIPAEATEITTNDGILLIKQE